MAPGKCPKCESYVTVLHAHALQANLGGSAYKAVTFHCPNPLCQAVLGCQVDPIAVKAEIVQAVADLLGK
jgi:hypothetical protein